MPDEPDLPVAGADETQPNPTGRARDAENLAGAPPKKARKQHRGKPHDDGWQERFLEHYRTEHSIFVAALKTPVDRSTVYAEKERDPLFRRAMREIASTVNERIRGGVIKRGLDGWLEPVFQGGKQIGEKRVFSDRLLELAARGRLPEEFNRGPVTQEEAPTARPEDTAAAIREFVKMAGLSVPGLPPPIESLLPPL